MSQDTSFRSMKSSDRTLAPPLNSAAPHHPNRKYLLSTLPIFRPLPLGDHALCISSQRNADFLKRQHKTNVSLLFIKKRRKTSSFLRFSSYVPQQNTSAARFVPSFKYHRFLFLLSTLFILQILLRRFIMTPPSRKKKKLTNLTKPPHKNDEKENGYV